MAHEIHLTRIRKALDPRREPYWGAPLAKGAFLGVRKRRDGSCTWIARWRDEEAKQRYRSLGQVTDAFDYGKAKAVAEEWFDSAEHGAPEAQTDTVTDACKAYVEDLEADDRPAAAHEAKTRFKKYVDEHALGKTKLQRLRTKSLKAWRNEVGGSKANQNRNWTSLRAALNLAVSRGRVSPKVEVQWRAVKAHKDADGRRTVCLNLKQRRALLAAASGTLHDLLAAAALTGARPGELVSATRAQFDRRAETFTWCGKTGTRTVPLSPAAIALFKRLAKDKLPAAPLLTQADGERWYKGAWAELVRDAARAAGLPPGTVLYTLRHSWITEALRSGMTTLDVCRLAGTSLTMIEKYYGHLVVDSARERLALVTML